MLFIESYIGNKQGISSTKKGHNSLSYVDSYERSLLEVLGHGKVLLQMPCHLVIRLYLFLSSNSVFSGLIN
ncbi:serine--glyoxylate aminotransferase-like [Iris pallida]|uniref:Serine--glyoxylate aminotransferase-like n=1 Tax=Iris pallida TaxID=29817 RepID=A0AAX6H9S8_IRIPA|nr:serine--glyoxylate aminotransferase-like [Iris pallida]